MPMHYWAGVAREVASIGSLVYWNTIDLVVWEEFGDHQWLVISAHSRNCFEDLWREILRGLLIPGHSFHPHEVSGYCVFIL